MKCVLYPLLTVHTKFLIHPFDATSDKCQNKVGHGRWAFEKGEC